jgi:hypothetical protein
MAHRKYIHQTIRPNPFPQDWTSPSGDYTLLITRGDIRIKNPVVEVIGKNSSAFYQIIKS